MTLHVTNLRGEIWLQIGSVQKLIDLVPREQCLEALRRLLGDAAVADAYIELVEKSCADGDADTEVVVDPNGSLSHLQMARERLIRLAEPATQQYLARLRQLFTRAEAKNKAWRKTLSRDASVAREKQNEAETRESAIRTELGHVERKLQRFERAAARLKKIKAAQSKRQAKNKKGSRS